MADAPVDDILGSLRWLIAADTQNPPRDLTPAAPLFTHLRDALPGFETAVRDYGDGCLAFSARRGAPRTLFNVHLDTVPIAPGWSLPPHEVTDAGDRVHGLGTCDIKGAVACLMTAAAATDHPAAFLFTTDEEAGNSAAVRGYLESAPAFERVIVAEPTLARPVLAHRGILSAEARFAGRSGHASGRGISAVHEAARFVAKSLDRSWADDIRLNFGRIEGGQKPNMIAGHCAVRFGFRCPPGEDPTPYLSSLSETAGSHLSALDRRFEGPALPPTGADAAERQARLGDALERLGLSPAHPVDFWTEASLFAAAGFPVAVLGPGDIAQAHTADEWVTKQSLADAYDAYVRILSDG